MEFKYLENNQLYGIINKWMKIGSCTIQKPLLVGTSKKYFNKTNLDQINAL